MSHLRILTQKRQKEREKGVEGESITKHQCCNVLKTRHYNYISDSVTQQT